MITPFNRKRFIRTHDDDKKSSVIDGLNRIGEDFKVKTEQIPIKGSLCKNVYYTIFVRRKNFAETKEKVRNSLKFKE